MIDGLKLAQSIEAAGMPEAQARAVAAGVRDVLSGKLQTGADWAPISEYITRSDLEAALARQKAQFVLYGFVPALFLSMCVLAVLFR
ncbi:MAG: CCDC90 family protein [Proteobacteria bacterium]|nr:CCDC90 family protein [Pseudomonadota bacterium]